MKKTEIEKTDLEKFSGYVEEMISFCQQEMKYFTSSQNMEMMNLFSKWKIPSVEEGAEELAKLYGYYVQMIGDTDTKIVEYRELMEVMEKLRKKQKKEVEKETEIEKELIQLTPWMHYFVSCGGRQWTQLWDVVKEFYDANGANVVVHI